MILLAATGQAMAQSGPPIEKICVKTSDGMLVSRSKLAAWLVDGKVSPGALDLDGDDGQSSQEKILSVAQPTLCLDRKTCAAKDKDALIEANLTVDQMIKDRLPDFRLLKRDAEKPTVKSYLQLGHGEIMCAAKAQEDRPNAAPASKGLLDPVRIRGQVSDLAIDRADGAKFDTAKFADLSFLDNRKTKRQTFDINAVVGAYFGYVEMLGGSAAMAPYVQYQRQFVDKNTSGKPLNNKLSFGLMLGGYGHVDEFFWDYSIYPQYITDDKFRTDVGSMTAIFAPHFDLPYYGKFCCGGWINARWTLDARGSFGYVFDDGGDKALKDKKEFARVGGRATLLLRGGEEYALKNFQLDLTYTHLFNLLHSHKDLPRFDAVLAYVFPDTKYFSLQLKYARGYAEDTLVNEEFYKVSFGIRY